MSDANPKNKLVRDDAWQTVRKSLLGQWKEHPEQCCSKLRAYLGAIATTDNDKIRVVMNYLVGSGFRTGRIKHSCISTLRTQMSSEIKKRKAQSKW